MDNTRTTQNIISYCSGIRGIETGLERSGLPVKTIAFLEIEAFIVANLVAQMEVGLLAKAPIWTNIKTFDARPFRNKIHGIVGGYPCQPFSHAGERRGVEDERHLFPYILEQIKIIGPDWVFFENVGGHLSMGYAEVRRSLSDIGYQVEEGIFTAEEVGAPHRRERLFILGVMENAGLIGWGRRRFGDTQRNECEDKIKGPSPTLDNGVVQCSQSGAQASDRWKSESPVSSRKLADTHSNDTGTDVGNISGSEGNGIIETYQRERLRGEFGTLNSEMDNSFQERSITEASLFPAGQGTFQYDWEEPRTIESSMVYTIDGYNFTEDLHRAIGNSVVEQVAELAFLSLLQKQLKNL